MSEASEYFVGIDLGGTKIAAGVFQNGKVLQKHRLETDAERGSGPVIADLVELVRQISRDHGGVLGGVGIGVPGQIETKTGHVAFAPNLHWKDVPLGRELREGLGCSIAVTNDVRAITYGEWTYGAGRGVDDLVCVFVGTGIGGGILVNGELLEGSGGSAGEVGHLTIVAGGRKCTCPGKGCWEAYAGGWGIGARTQEAVAADPTAGAMILEKAYVDNDEVSAKHLSQAFHAGDALAKKLVEETALFLGAGITSLVNILNPQRVILGGGVIDGIPELMDLTKAQVRANALDAANKVLEIVPAALGSDAGIAGSAALAANRKG